MTNDRVTIKHYHATREECLFCSENKNCIKTKGDKQKGYRTIEDRNLASKQRMQEKMKKEKSKEILPEACLTVVARRGNAET